MITKPEDMTFENFPVNEANLTSFEAAQAMVNDHEKFRLKVFILPAAESFHLKHAIQNCWTDSVDFISITASELAFSLVKAFCNGTHQTWSEEFIIPDILIIDDLFYVAYKEATQEELYKLLKLRMEDEKSTVLFTVCPLEQSTPGWRPELLDLLEMGME